MKFLFTILILAAAVSAVLVPIFFGFGLAEGRAAPVLLALAFLGLAAVLFFLVSRFRRGEPMAP